MDFEELFSGYSNKDEFIARDMLLIELLISKGVLTRADISKTFTPEKLTHYIDVVQKERKAEAKRRIEEHEKENNV